MKRFIEAWLRLVQGYAPAPSALRNHAGGMAWIRSCPDVPQVLAGRVVITTSSDDRGFWTIDPPQQFVLHRHMLTVHERLASPGEKVCLVSMHDDCLQPIPDTGVTEREVRALYALKQQESA